MQGKVVITSGQINLTKGRIAAAHGRLNRIRQSKNQNGTSTGSAVFAQLTAQRPYTLQRATLSSLKIVHSSGGFGPHLIHDSFVYPNPKSKRHLDQFSRFRMAHDCDRPTERPTNRRRYSVSNNRPHLRK